MYKGKKVLGFIPARGGSKGLPGKNIRVMCDKPLICWTIEKARQSTLLDKVVVSTDSEDIGAISKEAGACVPFFRPAELASDTATSADASIHALDYFQAEKFDYLCLLEPTSPLRKDDDIDRAIKKLVDNEDRADSLVSLGKVHMEHPLIVKKIVAERFESFIDDAEKITQRQELNDSYFPYGVIYLIKTEVLRKEKTFYTKRNIHFLIERWQNYEVDDIYDFVAIEAIMKKRMEK